jgi:hypothetical protein
MAIATTTRPAAPAAVSAPAARVARSGLGRVRLWPAVAALSVVVTGMAFSLWSRLVTTGVNEWRMPGDIWGIMRVAHLMGWGGYADIYAHGSLMNAAPGIALVLVPVAKLGDLLNLSEPYPFPLHHPSGWLAVGPAEMVLGALVLFPLDATARRLGIEGARRIALLWAEAALVWPVVAMWGHPEDLVALGFALYALLAVADGRSDRAAVLFGVAIAFQPLVVLAVPVGLAYVGWRHWARFAVAAAAPSALLLAVPLAYQWRATTFAVVTQPTFPTVDHATPWVSLAPVVATLHPHVSGFAAKLTPNAAAVQTAVTEVTAGHTRLLAVAAVAVLAAWTAKRRPPLTGLLWVAGVALATRCLFDPVLCPYYAVPALAPLVMAGAASGWRRGVLTAVAAGACTWAGYRHAGPWGYFLPVALALAAAAAFSMPPGLWRRAPSQGATAPPGLLRPSPLP